MIGILSSALFSVLNPLEQINKSKDVQRQYDIGQIKTALDAYYNDHNRYPNTLSELTFGSQPYIKTLPKDPITESDYFYAKDNNSLQWNILFAKLSRTQSSQSSCPLRSLTDCIPLNFDDTWACSLSGKVDCGYLAANVTLPSSGIVPTSPPPTSTPTSSPTPTPNPNPVLVASTIAGVSAPYDVFVSGDYAYVVIYSNNRLNKFDVSGTGIVSTPVASALTGTYPFSVFVSGNYVYVAGSYFLQKFDVSNLSLTATVSTAGYSSSVFVSGDYAYVVGSGSNTLQKFDVSGAGIVSTPVASVSTGGTPTSVFISSDYAYVVTRNPNTLQKYDVSGTGIVSTPVASVSTVNSATSVFISGDYAYVVTYQSGDLQKYDISTNTLSLVGSVYNGTDGAYPQSVFVSGNYAYVVNSSPPPRTLKKYDIRTNTPSLVGSAAMTGRSLSVFVSGNYAYVANFDEVTLQKFYIGD